MKFTKPREYKTCPACKRRIGVRYRKFISHYHDKTHLCPGGGKIARTIAYRRTK